MKATLRTQNNKNRSRRLRKKLYVGEFKEMGFEIKTHFKVAPTKETHWKILDRFLSEAVESRTLIFGGGIDNGFISYSGRGSASQEDREAIRVWLTNCPELEDVQIGELIDAWYM